MPTTAPRLVFADGEMTGTDPRRHHLWEWAMIVRDPDGPENEYAWQFVPDLRTADPAALRIGRYYERNRAAATNNPATLTACPEGIDHPDVNKNPDLRDVAGEVAQLLSGAVLIAANVGFDAAFLDKFLRANGQAPAWDYHLIEIESYVAGALGEVPPWKLDQLAELAGIPLQPEGDRHTALGDARLVRDLWDATASERIDFDAVEARRAALAAAGSAR